MLLEPGSTEGLWPVYKGASFDTWSNDTGEYYGWIEPGVAQRVLNERRQASIGRKGSPFGQFPRSWFENPDSLPCLHPRLAFRRITRATDSRTVRACLVPPNVVLTDVAPYLLWPVGDERDQAYLLGVMSSLPLDWYARRMVETHLDFHVLCPFPVPRAPRENELRRIVEVASARLAAVDGRYEEWGASVGVPVASVESDEAENLVATIDAAVARLYGLSKAEVVHIFETFHVGWDYGARLEAVLAQYQSLGSTK